jgi:RimJ/RimL family protein N-acetyltransferase
MFPDLTRDDVFRIETRRLWLRWPRQADAEAILRLAGEREVAEMTALIPHPYPPEGATAFVFESRKANALGQALRLAITPNRKPNQLIGIVGIERGREDGLPHLGYWLGTPHWGKGFAIEAARALVDAYFAYMDGRELVSATRVTNPASRRVLEACGFACTGAGLMAFPARGGNVPVDRFRLDRPAWEGLRTPARGTAPSTPYQDDGRRLTLS